MLQPAVIFVFAFTAQETHDLRSPSARDFFHLLRSQFHRFVFFTVFSFFFSMVLRSFSVTLEKNFTQVFTDE